MTTNLSPRYGWQSRPRLMVRARVLHVKKHQPVKAETGSNPRRAVTRRLMMAERKGAMRVAIYARVSTANNGQDPTMQTRELREYAERRGWQGFAEYSDVGISGTKERRPELDRLMADARRRRFDCVVVWKFDRFARSVSHLLRALETFNALGIAFVSLTARIDT